MLLCTGRELFLLLCIGFPPYFQSRKAFVAALISNIPSHDSFDQDTLLCCDSQLIANDCKLAKKAFLLRTLYSPITTGHWLYNCLKFTTFTFLWLHWHILSNHCNDCSQSVILVMFLGTISHFGDNFMAVLSSLM